MEYEKDIWNWQWYSGWHIHPISRATCPTEHVAQQETIMSAEEIEDRSDHDLLELFSRWKGNIDHIGLKPFIINLNSSGSRIKIIAESFSVEKIGSQEISGD